MVSKAKRYLDDTFEVVVVLHENQKSKVSLVLNKIDKQIYVLKCVQHINLSYQKLQEFSHPFLAEIFYVFEDNEKTYIVEEYINGINLSDLVREKGTLSEKQVKHIVVQLCSCLEFLHQKDIIHRDIKPSNIIYKEDGTIKLIDFDAARMLSKDKETDTKLLGTKGYAPPEQYGFAQTDQRSDIYAVGMTMKDLLGSQYSGRLKKVIARCIKIDPEQRVSSAKKLQNLLQSEPNLYIKYFSVFVVLVGIFVLGIFLWNKKSDTMIESWKSVSQVANEIGNDSIKAVKEDNPKEADLEKEEKIELKKESIQNESSLKTSLISSRQIKVGGQKWNVFKRRDDSYNYAFLSTKQKEFLKTFNGSFYIAKNKGDSDMLVIENQSDIDLVDLCIRVEFHNVLIDKNSHDFFDPPDAKCVYSYENRDEATGLYQSVTCMRQGKLPSNHRRGIIFDFTNSLVIGSNPRIKITFSSKNSESFFKEETIEIL